MMGIGGQFNIIIRAQPHHVGKGTGCVLISLVSELFRDFPEVCIENAVDGLVPYRGQFFIRILYHSIDHGIQHCIHFAMNRFVIPNHIS